MFKNVDKVVIFPKHFQVKNQTAGKKDTISQVPQKSSFHVTKVRQIKWIWSYIRAVNIKGTVPYWH